jgi:hypothetical protein
MIKLPKFFNPEDYIALNGDIRYYKNINPTNHFLTNGYSENRKYNIMANSNYPFKLHLIEISNNNYDYFDDLIIDFKLNQNIKYIYRKFELELNYDLRTSYHGIIDNILNDPYNDFIEKGIYCERSLAKHLSQNKLNELLHRYITCTEPFDEIVITKPKDIFSIQNKYRFFYEFFKFNTKYVTSMGFEIKNSINNNKTAVIIETRNHLLFKHIIYNIMFNLGTEWNLHIFCGFDNYNYVKTTFPKVKITLLPFYNLSVDLYDFICLNKFFWNSIDTEDILIFQTDTFLIDKIDETINDYVYLGAPHLNIHEKISYLSPNNFGLNGGLSLRKKSAMIHCINNIKVSDIDNYRISKNCKEIHRTPINIVDIDIDFFVNNFGIKLDSFDNMFNTDLIYEDVYFSHAIEMLNYPLPNMFVSKYFILQENIFGKIYNIKGVHGWDKNYMPLEYHKTVLKKYVFRLFNKINNKSSLLKLSDSVNNNSLQKMDFDTIINILIVCHNMGGGTEKYVRDIININKKYINENYPDKKINFDLIRIKESNSQSTNILFNNINIKLTNKSGNFLKNTSYDIIHIHYLNEPAFILYDFIMEIMLNHNYKPRLIVTLHDYHFIVNDKANEYHLSIFNSNQYFLDELKLNKINIIAFEKYKKLFLEAELLVTGSSTLKIIYNYVFNLNPDLIKVVQHPEPIYFSPINLPLDLNTLKIAVIGAISISKGSHMIQEMSNYITKANIPWKIYHIGNGFHYDIKKTQNINSIGSFASECELKQLLIKYGINMLWFPAFRHESFCYTLTLAMQTGLPIIAYDSGTFKDRLSHYSYPYKIHNSEFNCEDLFFDIQSFWNDLKSGKYTNTTNETFTNTTNETFTNTTNETFTYDNINYSRIYDI